MRLPLAAVGALVAALLETSVLPDLRIAGVKPDLILVLATITAMTLGVEDGLVWAFLGGLMLDLLVPERVPGVTTLVLLLTTGVAILVRRAAARSRVAAPVLAVFALTWPFQVGIVGLLIATTEMGVISVDVASLLRISLLNALVALLIAIPARQVWLRFGQPDRLGW
jgi:rod shape-determining protein MreD